MLKKILSGMVVLSIVCLCKFSFCQDVSEIIENHNKALKSVDFFQLSSETNTSMNVSKFEITDEEFKERAKKEFPDFEEKITKYLDMDIKLVSDFMCDIGRKKLYNKSKIFLKLPEELLAKGADKQDQKEALKQMEEPILDFEQYVIGDGVYIHTDEGWSKTKVKANSIKNYFDPHFPEVTAYLSKDFIVPKIVGEEAIGQTKCYVLEFSISDNEKLLEFLKKYYNLGDILKNLRGMHTDINDIKYMSLKLWIAKDSYLPVMDVLNLNFSISADGRLPKLPEYNVKLAMEMFMYVSTRFSKLSKSIQIQLPKEAQEAKEIIE